ncbi:MAG: adenylate/guanylate cyclase domain-containing protein [Syntrophaceae bacterium]|nr:adenylate/guanylate cyclase domain-containing protein [Syntrophaceae bacterium]
MLPESIPRYSVGPLFGFVANAVMTILCLIVMALYRHYRPLRGLLFFNLFITFCFSGWVLYSLQGSPESILLGYRVMFAALAMLPASWLWFYSTLINERPSGFTWALTGTSLFLAAVALLGEGPGFFGFPLEPDRIAVNVLRPQSQFLRPLILCYCLIACLFYLSWTVVRLRRFKEERTYLLPAASGLLIWFLGGVHDSLRVAGVTIFIKEQILWFASFWLSVFLTIAVGLHFRSLERAVREARDVFERFVPPAYLRRIAREGLAAIRLGEADRQWVTILCCDIRGFTALSEQLNPGELLSFLNQILERMTSAVTQNQGVIDKFIGDAILCIFEEPNSAERGVACGLDMLSLVKSFNGEKNLRSDQCIRIGIGLHSGPVILGTIGSSNRMDSTVLGLTVNLAKRLEELTKSLGVDMLISDQVASRLPTGHPYRLRRLGEVSVRGCSAPVGVAEVSDHRLTRDPERGI